MQKENVGHVLWIKRHGPWLFCTQSYRDIVVLCPVVPFCSLNLLYVKKMKGVLLSMLTGSQAPQDMQKVGLLAQIMLNWGAVPCLCKILGNSCPVVLTILQNIRTYWSVCRMQNRAKHRLHNLYIQFNSIQFKLLYWQMYLLPKQAFQSVKTKY